MSNRMTLPSLLVGAALLALLLAAPVATAAPAGPQLAKCGKLKRAAGSLDGRAKRAVLIRFRRCLRQNRANAIAFHLIKNTNLVGRRGDGMYVDWTFCANGKYALKTSDGPVGTAVSEGRWWRTASVVAVQNGKSFNAIIEGQGGLSVGIQRRGARWFVGIESFDKIIEPGEVKRTNAAAACRRL